MTLPTELQKGSRSTTRSRSTRALPIGATRITPSFRHSEAWVLQASRACPLILRAHEPQMAEPHE